MKDKKKSVLDIYNEVLNNIKSKYLKDQEELKERENIANTQRNEILRIRKLYENSLSGHIDKCRGASRWPNDVLIPSDVFIPSDPAGSRITLESGSPVGTRAFIAQHASLSPGNDIFERHTGEMATMVDAGDGDEGSSWTFESFPDGTLISTNDGIPTYIVLSETNTTIYSDNGGTGKLGLDYFTLNNDGLVPTFLSIVTEDSEGITTNRSKFLDPCRRLHLNYSEDFTTFISIDNGPFRDSELLIGIDTSTFFPISAANIQLDWKRGRFDQTTVDF